MPGGAILNSLMKYSEEEREEFQRFWNKLDDEGRAHSFECQSGGYMDFVKGKGRFWIVTPEFVAEMYRSI